MRGRAPGDRRVARPRRRRSGSARPPRSSPTPACASRRCAAAGSSRADDEGDATAALDDNRRAIVEAATLGTRELIMVVGGLPAATAPGGPALPGTAPAATSSAPGSGWPTGSASSRRSRPGTASGSCSSRCTRSSPPTARSSRRSARRSTSRSRSRPDVVGVVVDTYHVWWDPDLQRQIARAGAAGRIAATRCATGSCRWPPTPLLSRGHVGDGYVDFATITRWVRRRRLHRRRRGGDLQRGHLGHPGRRDGRDAGGAVRASWCCRIL